MRQIIQTGDPAEDVSRLIRQLNYPEVVLPFPVVGTEEGFPVAGALFGGIAVARAVFRMLLPDARWLVYGAGWVDPMDVNTATISIVYQKDNAALVTLGSTTAAGAGYRKIALGPFDVFATLGVPAAEAIPSIRLGAAKNAGVNGQVAAFVLWLRLLPRSQ